MPAGWSSAGGSIAMSEGIHREASSGTPISRRTFARLTAGTLLVGGGLQLLLEACAAPAPASPTAALAPPTTAPAAPTAPALATSAPAPAVVPTVAPTAAVAAAPTSGSVG